MTPPAYHDLMRVARRYSRRPDEAEDLVQDALLAAIADGRDPTAVANRRWLVGVIRNRAAFAARSAARRLQRETLWQQELKPDDTTSWREALPTLLAGLPPSLKSVAALALSGHSRGEVLYLLGISDTALRQRLTALKRRFAAMGVEWPAQTPGLGLALDYGRIRDALLPRLVREGGLFASHDPDGHLFIVRRSQTAPARQQGSDQSQPQEP